MRLAQPHTHFEAISSRPLLLHGAATHTHLIITSLHAKQSAIQAVLTNLAGFLSTLKSTAEQWTDADRLRAMLTRAFAKFMLPTAGPPVLPTAKPATTERVDCRFWDERQLSGVESTGATVAKWPI